MNEIIHADCLNYMKTIKDNSIDLIYLDPPYKTNYAYEASKLILEKKY